MKKFGIVLIIITLVFSSCKSSHDTTQRHDFNATIGIIGAMQEEVDILKNKMTIINEVEEAGMTFYTGTLHNKKIVLAKSGIGKVNAGVCAQLMITLFNIKYLINSGVAGGMNQMLNQGDIVISKDAVQHDFDLTAFGSPLGEIAGLGIIFFKADNYLVQIAEKAAQQAKLADSNFYFGRIASGDQFIAGGEKAENIKKHFAPYAVEMEGAAIAQVAYINQVPFVIIRAISDNADGEAALSFNEFLPIAAQNASTMIDNMILLLKEK
ncbi:MAG: 5'-methylthioadenosine/adenosylhomocysteine nucleosidase [Spirochaetes bacterium]|nr:5'-methylthioadenosine/adenosylhomocysteine nucleosidase [Spirochaetota bacterium]